MNEDERDCLIYVVVALFWIIPLLLFLMHISQAAPAPPASVLTWETKAICEGRRCCDFIIYSSGRIAPTGDCIWRSV